MIKAFSEVFTPEVRDDIVSLLGMREPQVFVSGFDRPNIELRVRPVTGDREKRALLPELVGKSRSLVYASTRKSAEDASETLVDAGIAAAAYHAGLSDTERTRVQDAFAAVGTVTDVVLKPPDPAKTRPCVEPKEASKGFIAYVDGGGTWHSEDWVNPKIGYWVQKGYTVLDPNYRGSTGFGYTHREAVKDDGWGGREQGHGGHELDRTACPEQV